MMDPSPDLPSAGRPKVSRSAPGTSLALALLGVAVALGACAGDDDPTGASLLPPASIELAANLTGVEVFDSVRLGATVRDARGNTLPDVEVEWQTGDPQVLEVRGDYLVGTGVGRTTLTASVGGVTASTETAAQSPPLDRLETDFPELWIGVGSGSHPLPEVRAIDRRGRVVPGILFGWSSDDPDLLAIVSPTEFRPDGETGDRGSLRVRTLNAGSANTSLEVPARLTERWTAIETASLHSCALDPNGRAWCWGVNHAGRLGTGSPLNDPGFGSVLGDVRFEQIEVGNHHTCGLEAGTGRAFCWGSNLYGQLGVGAHTPPGAMPQGATSVDTDRRFRDIDGAEYQVCAVALDDSVWC